MLAAVIERPIFARAARNWADPGILALPRDIRPQPSRVPNLSRRARQARDL